MLTKKAHNELKAILKKDYGQEPSDEEIHELGMSLLRLTRIALKTQARLEAEAKPLT